jgi:hypothetical protein
VSFSVWGLWAGIGIAALWQRLKDRLEGSWSRAAPVLLLALIPLILNWSWASRRSDYSARDWAYNLLMSVEPYGVLFTNGDNDTFPLWYLQEAEGIRRDVTVIVTSYLNLDWYVKQLRDITRPCPPGVRPEETPTVIVCQRPYHAADSEPLYTHDPSLAAEEGRVALLLDAASTLPTRSIIALEDSLIEQVAGPGGFVPLNEDREFQLGPVTGSMPGGTVVFPWQQFALSLIQNSIGDRPIYFASSGSAAQSLGLVPYLVRQGVAFRLNPGPPDLTEGNMLIQEPQLIPVTGPWLDVERTTTLVERVFIHRSGIPDAWPHWPDRSTIGIPNYYAWVYAALAQVALQEGDDELRSKYEERLTAWQGLGGR